MPDKPLLYYIHDPMCSWCWGFSSSWQKLRSQLDNKVTIRYILGGLAKDSDQLMPFEMQANIRDNWRQIEKTVPGVYFNFDFWEQCRPRRSTYPACRAVIAARQQRVQAEYAMIERIQQAYYQQALNPSDDAVLVAIAEQLHLDLERFSRDLSSQLTQAMLDEEISLSRSLGVSSFPSLVLSTNRATLHVEHDYVNAESMLEQINQALQRL